MIIKAFALSLLLLQLSVLSYAHAKISGIITDASTKKPIKDAVAILSGTHFADTSLADGSFTIAVSSDSIRAITARGNVSISITGQDHRPLVITKVRFVDDLTTNVSQFTKLKRTEATDSIEYFFIGTYISGHDTTTMMQLNLEVKTNQEFYIGKPVEVTCTVTPPMDIPEVRFNIGFENENTILFTGKKEIYAGAKANTPCSVRFTVMPVGAPIGIGISASALINGHVASSGKRIYQFIVDSTCGRFGTAR